MGFRQQLWIFRACLASLYIGVVTLGYAEENDILELLTDPFLQRVEKNSLRVIWFTEFQGKTHSVVYGKNLDRRAPAQTTKLSRTVEDNASHHSLKPETERPVARSIWRHEATLTQLQRRKTVSYYVISMDQYAREVHSKVFTAPTQPLPGTPLTLLLTSDHQLKPRTAANIQKASEVAGAIHAVLVAGDLVNIPDRASEWFDDSQGNAFFPVLQGRANYRLQCGNSTFTYQGASLLQSAPIFPAIGNHEVMGRYRPELSLSHQFPDAYPRDKAKEWLRSQGQNITEDAIRDNSFNTITYEEIFSLPPSQEGGERYYAATFGDVRIVSLFVTRIWRPGPEEAPSPKWGKYGESPDDLNNPEKWGYGSHIFETIKAGSAQYQWLSKELKSSAWLKAKTRVIMFHHPIHTLGDKAMPAFTDPEQILERDTEGQLRAVRYEYPLERHELTRYLAPLIEESGAHLVLYGHSHVWNRFQSPKGIHYLETSNVGNSYGAFWGNARRPNLPRNPKNPNDYVASGNPYDLAPIVPTLAPLKDKQGTALPYISSNELTVFSLMDTGTRKVRSYYWDPCRPESPASKFDEFSF